MTAVENCENKVCDSKMADVKTVYPAAQTIPPRTAYNGSCCARRQMLERLATFGWTLAAKATNNKMKQVVSFSIYRVTLHGSAGKSLIVGDKK